MARTTKPKVLDEPIFRDPPSKDPLVPALRKLVEHPDQWAVIATYEAPTTAGNRARTLTKNPPLGGNWEFAGHPAEESEGSELFAVYHGGLEPPPSNGNGSQDKEEARRRAAAEASG